MKNINILIIGLVLAILLMGCNKTTDVENENSKESKRVSVVNNNDNNEISYEEISFGSYNGKPYKWIVLERNEGKMLLLAKRLIAVQSLDIVRNEKIDITWENCACREWLNSSFIDDIFNEEEKGLILETNNANGNDNTTNDRVFLLSKEEAKHYFKEGKQLECQWASNYAPMHWWWLRTFCDNHKYANYVDDNGYINTDGNEISKQIGIRPAMWVGY